MDYINISFKYTYEYLYPYKIRRILNEQNIYLTSRSDEIQYECK